MRVLRSIILGLGGRVVVGVTIIVAMTVLHIIALWLFLMLLPYFCYGGINDIDHGVDSIIYHCDCSPKHPTQILKPKTQTPNPKPSTPILNHASQTLTLNFRQKRSCSSALKLINLDASWGRVQALQHHTS